MSYTTFDLEPHFIISLLYILYASYRCVRIADFCFTEGCIESICDRPPNYAADGGPITPEEPPLDHYPPPCITLVSASTSSNSSLSSASSSAESKAVSVVLESEEEHVPIVADSSGYLADSLGDSQPAPTTVLPTPLAEKPKKKKKRVSEADKVQAELALESSQDPDEWHPDRRVIPPELLQCLRPMICAKKVDPDYMWLFADSEPLKSLADLSFVDMSSALDTGISRDKRRKIANAKRRSGANFFIHEICTGLKVFVKRYLLEKDGKSHGENEWNVAAYLRNKLRAIDPVAFFDPPVMVPIDYIKGPSERAEDAGYVYGYVVYNYEAVVTLSDLKEKTKADRGYPTRLETLKGLKDIASIYALLDRKEGAGIFTHNELHPGQVLFLKHGRCFQLGDLSHASVIGADFDIGPPKMIAGSCSTEWRELFSMFLKSGLVRKQDRALVQDCMNDADRLRVLEKLGTHMKRIETEKDEKKGEEEEITSV